MKEVSKEVKGIAAYIVPPLNERQVSIFLLVSTQLFTFIESAT